MALGMINEEVKKLLSSLTEAVAKDVSKDNLIALRKKLNDFFNECNIAGTFDSAKEAVLKAIPEFPVLNLLYMDGLEFKNGVLVEPSAAISDSDRGSPISERGRSASVVSIASTESGSSLGSVRGAGLAATGRVSVYSETPALPTDVSEFLAKLGPSKSILEQIRDFHAKGDDLDQKEVARFVMKLKAALSGKNYDVAVEQLKMSENAHLIPVLEKMYDKLVSSPSAMIISAFIARVEGPSDAPASAVSAPARPSHVFYHPEASGKPEPAAQSGVAAAAP